MNLGESVADALLARPVEKLPLTESFVGAGVYAIYYGGPYEPYARISEWNREVYRQPIYVGKAVPSGARKGLVSTARPVLFKRISEHAETLNAANNLSVSDFFCQYLVVDDIWIPLGESLLIQRFSPLWNQVLDGFGNHDPGKGRYNQQKSAWDTLHPGRTWADRCRPNEKTADHWLSLIEKYMDDMLFPSEGS